MLILSLKLLSLANLVICYETSASSPFIITIREPYSTPKPTRSSFASSKARSFISSTSPPVEILESSTPVGFVSSSYDTNYLDPSGVKPELSTDGAVDLPGKYGYLPQYNPYARDNDYSVGAVRSSSEGRSYLDPQAQSSTYTNQLGFGQESTINSKIQYASNPDDEVSVKSQLQSLNPVNSYGYVSPATTVLNKENNYGYNVYDNSQSQYPVGNNGAKKTTWVNQQTLALGSNNNLNNAVKNNLNYNTANQGIVQTWVNPQGQPIDLNGNVLKNSWVNPQLESRTGNLPNNLGTINVRENDGRINLQSQNVNVAFNSRLGSFNYVQPQPKISPESSSGLGSSNYVNILPQRLVVNSAGEYSLDGTSFGSLSPPPVANAFAPPILKPQTTKSGKLEIAYQWRYLDWVHPSIQLTGKNFTVGNPFSQDVDIDRKGRVFVASPQWLEGTPVTLSVVTNLRDQGGPLLTPYPDWTWHRNDCNGLISVFRISIDECNRLWMVDTGIASGSRICPMKIVAFDLRKDELVHSYTIPEDQTESGNAQYVNPAVEVGESCDDTYVYVADIIKHGVLVYNLRENRSWRINNTRLNAFGDDPEARNLNIAGESVTLNDGILGMSLSPRGFFSKRYLYFNSLASFYQKFADVDTLKRSFRYEPVIYKSASRRISQAGPQAMSRTGAVFFQLAQFTAIACWNIERPFTQDNVVVLVQDERNLQYVSGMKVIVNAFGEEELWFNTNRLQKIINGSRRQDEINFRLIRGNVNDLIKGTRCEPTGYRTGGPSLLGWNRI